MNVIPNFADLAFGNSNKNGLIVVNRVDIFSSLFSLAYCAERVVTAFSLADTDISSLPIFFTT